MARDVVEGGQVWPGVTRVARGEWDGFDGGGRDGPWWPGVVENGRQ